MAGTRSRPYHSDDNAHVEHKNWMWPRQLLGYGGLKPEELVGPLSARYESLDPFGLQRELEGGGSRFWPARWTTADAGKD